MDLAACGWRHDPSPCGGEAPGANPTDRGTPGTKRGVRTEGRGIPLAIVAAGANRHGMNLWAQRSTPGGMEPQLMPPRLQLLGRQNPPHHGGRDVLDDGLSDALGCQCHAIPRRPAAAHEIGALAGQAHDVNRHRRGKSAHGTATGGVSQAFQALGAKPLGPFAHHGALDAHGLRRPGRRAPRRQEEQELSTPGQPGRKGG
jgi:hypothetical protein